MMTSAGKTLRISWNAPFVLGYAGLALLAILLHTLSRGATTQHIFSLPGAFEYANPDYPDIDDTAAIGMALDRAGDPANREAVERAAEWILGLQSANGGWGAVDADNTRH